MLTTVSREGRLLHTVSGRLLHTVSGRLLPTVAGGDCYTLWREERFNPGGNNIPEGFNPGGNNIPERFKPGRNTHLRGLNQGGIPT